MVASELVVPGKTTAVFITLNNLSGPKQPLNVTLRLLTNGLGVDDSSSMLVEITQEIAGKSFSFKFLAEIDRKNLFLGILTFLCLMITQPHQDFLIGA